MSRVTAPATELRPAAEPPSRAAGRRAGPRVTELHARLLGPRPASTALGWAAMIGVAVIGGILRFWRLDQPHKLVFDETYYVKQGASYLRAGYELRWNSDKTAAVDARFTRGETDVFLDEPDRAVHPPVGKWMIAVGEWIFGPGNTAGWRFSAAVVGTLSILMIALIARRMFRSTLLGVTAGLLLAVDGHHFVHSRTGLLDVFLMFWVLAAFGCLLIDRDAGRRQLADRVAAGKDGLFGPALGVRPWRLAAAVCLGLAVGTKWSGLYFVAVFCLMSVLWDVGARRAAGIRHWWGGLLRDGVPAALTMLPIIAVTYLASWTGWLVTSGGYHRQWAAEHPSAHFGWIPDALRSLWYYHQESYRFHVTLSSPHPYSANPWSWIVMGRPTAFHYEGHDRGQAGCVVDKCSEAITALGNPVVWWGGTLAIGVLLFAWVLRRDWRAGAILAGLVAGYLPWFWFQDRTIYNFYAVAFVPYVVLGLTFALGLVLGPSRSSPRRRLVGGIVAGGVVVLAVITFWYFLPVLSAEVIPQVSWSDRMWLPSWI